MTGETTLVPSICDRSLNNKHVVHMLSTGNTTPVFPKLM